MTTIEASSAQETVEEFYRRVDTNDVAGLATLFVDDARYVRPGFADLQSRAEIEHFYRHDRVIAAGSHRLDDIVVETHDRCATAAVRGEFAGRLRDGSLVQHRFAEFFEIGADGLFLSRETFFAVPHV